MWAEDIVFFTNYVGGQLDIEDSTKKYRCVGEIKDIVMASSAIVILFSWRACREKGVWVEIEEKTFSFDCNDYHSTVLKMLDEEYLVFSGLKEFVRITFISRESRKKMDPRIIVRPKKAA